MSNIKKNRISFIEKILINWLLPFELMSGLVSDSDFDWRTKKGEIRKIYSNHIRLYSKYLKKKQEYKGDFYRLFSKECKSSICAYTRLLVADRKGSI